jgi:hypothetical protein
MCTPYSKALRSARRPGRSSLSDLNSRTRATREAGAAGRRPHVIESATHSRHGTPLRINPPPSPRQRIHYPTIVPIFQIKVGSLGQHRSAIQFCLAGYHRVASPAHPENINGCTGTGCRSFNRRVSGGGRINSVTATIIHFPPLPLQRCTQCRSPTLLGTTTNIP